MRNELNRKNFQAAINTTLSGLQPDPWLYQRIAARAEKGEIKVKKKIPAALVIALLITLIAAIAVAATLLTHQEVMEQVGIPLAVGNDSKVGVNESYSPEELAELVQALNENGITRIQTGPNSRHPKLQWGFFNTNEKLGTMIEVTNFEEVDNIIAAEKAAEENK